MGIEQLAHALEFELARRPKEAWRAELKSLENRLRMTLTRIFRWNRS
jgi:hypothetical protein